MKQDLKLRASISYLEDSIKEAVANGAEDGLDQTTLNHYYTPLIQDYKVGMYGRELYVPANMTFTGQLHKHHHFVILLKGKIALVSEEKKQVIEAPYVYTSLGGSKRAIHTLEDSILLNVHVSTKVTHQDHKKIEKEVIADSYEEIGLVSPDYTLLEDNT